MRSRPWLVSICLTLAVGFSTLSLAVVLPAAEGDLVSMVVELLNHADREFRAAGLDQVRTGAKGSSATKQFADHLRKLDAEGKVSLIGALAVRGDAAARPALLETLNSSQDENVRAAVIQSLGTLGDLSDLPLLVKTLGSTSGSEKAAARGSLAEMRGESVAKSLVAQMATVPTALKSSLIDVLATRRAKEAVPAFITASLDENGQIRGAAMNALGQIAGADQIAGMLPGVLRADKGGERDGAEKNVALVCAKISKEDERADKLIAAIESIDAAQRDVLLPLVGRVGGKKLINFVGDIATSNDPARRKIGVDALSKWPDASVADKLLEITNKSTDDAERNQAFQGFVKVSAVRVPNQNDKRFDKQRLDRMKQAMKIAKTPEEQVLVINRCRTAYDVETLRFVLPYVEQLPFAKIACETIVELAHHRDVREPHKDEFAKALDLVIATSKDAVVIDRANRYKRGETWTK